MLKSKKGFTLVELLAVIVILAIILAIAVPGISNIVDSSRKSAFESNVKMIISGIETAALEASFNGTAGPVETATPTGTTVDPSISDFGGNANDYSTFVITDMDPITITLISKDTSKFGGYGVNSATKASIPSPAKNLTPVVD